MKQYKFGFDGSRAARINTWAIFLNTRTPFSICFIYRVTQIIAVTRKEKQFVLFLEENQVNIQEALFLIGNNFFCLILRPPSMSWYKPIPWLLFMRIESSNKAG
jgi:hypothetical protein